MKMVRFCLSHSLWLTRSHGPQGSFGEKKIAIKSWNLFAIHFLGPRTKRVWSDTIAGFRGFAGSKTVGRQVVERKTKRIVFRGVCAGREGKKKCPKELSESLPDKNVIRYVKRCRKERKNDILKGVLENMSKVCCQKICQKQCRKNVKRNVGMCVWYNGKT